MTESRRAPVVSFFAFLIVACLVRADQPAKLDIYGDPLPAGAIARLGTVRGRHGDGASFVAFLPGGKVILTLGRDETVRQWDAATGKELRQFQLTDEKANNLPAGQAPSTVRPRVPAPIGGIPFGVALSADAKTLAVSSPNTSVRLFDVASGKELRDRRISGRSMSVAFSPDGKILAIHDGTGTIRLHEVATGKELSKWSQAAGDNERPSVLSRAALAFSPDGKVLASSMMSRSTTADAAAMILWDVATGKQLRRVALPTNQPRTRMTAFSPDGKILAWTQGRAVVLTDASSGREVRQLTCDGGPAFFGPLLFSPDGKSIASMDMQGEIFIWELASGCVIRHFAPVASRAVTYVLSGPGRLAFSSDGKLLAVTGINNAIRMLDVATGDEINPAGHRAPVFQMSFSRDGKTLLASDADQVVIVWDGSTSKEVRRISAPRDPTRIALADDGRHFASAHSGDSISVREAIPGKVAHTIKADLAFSNDVALAPDGKQIAFPVLVEETALIAVVDVATGKERHRLLPPVGNADPDGVLTAIPSGIPSGFRFSPDGQLLALRYDANHLVLWNLATGREHCRIETPPRSTVQAFVFSRDGRSVVIDLGDGPFGLWETATGKERRRYGNLAANSPGQDDRRVLPRGPGRGRFSSARPAVALSPDGRLLAHARPGGFINLWNVATGVQLSQLKGHGAELTALAFAPDGKSLASGSSDTTILIWDMAEFQTAKRPQRVVDIEARWRDLIGDDAARAFDAIHALASVPAQAVPLFEKQLRPIPIDAERVQRLITDLDSEQFGVRKQASYELEKIGEPATPFLRKALASDPSPEVHRRIEDLLSKIAGGAPRGESLQSLRAIEALEMIGTSQAKTVLKNLAKGASGATITQAAAAALERLKR
jgi:WD40 repeat protein